jgi:hypothetical protein
MTISYELKGSSYNTSSNETAVNCLACASILVSFGIQLTFETDNLFF